MSPPYADPSAPTARRLPAYPYFIAAVYLVFGEAYRAVYLAQVVLAVAVAGLLYLLAKQMLGERAAVLAVVL